MSREPVALGRQFSKNETQATGRQETPRLSPSPTLPADQPATLPGRPAGTSGESLRGLQHAARVFFHWKLRKSLALPHRPGETSMELTNRCNFRRAFCPQSNPGQFGRVAPTLLAPERATVVLSKLRGGASRASSSIGRSTANPASTSTSTRWFMPRCGTASTRTTSRAAVIS